MNMIAELMGGLVPNKEKITHDTIQETLENVAEELGCSYKELFIKITSLDEEFNPIFHLKLFILSCLLFSDKEPS